MRKREEMIDELGIKLWKRFDEKLREEGYETFVTTDPENGRGTTGFKKDKFAPIIRLHYWYFKGLSESNFISIHVKDRNGKDLLTGGTIHLYVLEPSKKDKLKNIEGRFEEIIKDVFERYAAYGEDNKIELEKNQSESLRTNY